MIDINVTADLKKMQRDLSRIKGAIPAIASRAVNELATWARQEAIRKVAADIGQRPSTVQFTVKNSKRTQRFLLLKATRGLPVARLRIDQAGIQFTDVAMMAVNPWNVAGRKHRRSGGGVKLRGGKFQPRAFKGMAKGKGTSRVWLMTNRPSDVNEGKMKLVLPRIGIAKKMERAFRSEIAGVKGATVFKQRFERMARLELAKAGIR